ncbi:MAG: hypothetical protein ACRELY_03465 [Polyangiaceae bacterium]
MTRKHAIYYGFLAVFAGAAITAACSAPDPGEVTFSTNPDKLRDGGIRIADSGGGGGGEGGVTGPQTAFTDAPDYVSGSGPTTDRAEHMARFGSQNPAGQSCLDCHAKGGDAGTTFTIGGTVFGPDDAGLNNVEVRVKEPDGTSIATYTNAEGNFFYLAAVGEPLADAGALSGVRNSDTEVETMPDSLPGTGGGSCNQKGTCHGGTQGHIYLP